MNLSFSRSGGIKLFMQLARVGSVVSTPQEPSGEGLILGETSVTAYRGDRGKTAYDHSQSAHAPADANNYVHPANHPASVVTQDTNNRFVSDDEKAAWNAKQAALVSGANLKTVNGATLLGSGDVSIPGGGGVSLGETSDTAYRGDRGKAAFDHALTAHAQLDVPITETCVNTAFNSSKITEGKVSITTAALCSINVSNENLIKPKDLYNASTLTSVPLVTGQSVELNGISATLNIDGTVTISGTANATIYLRNYVPQKTSYQYQSVKASAWCSGNVPAGVSLETGIYFDGATFGYNISSATKTKDGAATGFATNTMQLKITSGTVLSSWNVGLMLEQLSNVQTQYEAAFVGSDLQILTVNGTQEITLLGDVVNIISDVSMTLLYGYKSSELQAEAYSKLPFVQANPLNGKIILAGGDSIMYGQNFLGAWLTLLKRMNSKIVPLNKAVGGYTITNRTATVTYVEHNFDSYTGPTPNIVIVNGMMNDYLTQQPLGALVSSYNGTDTDKTTFIGALESLLRRLYTDFPNAKLGFVGTHQYDNGGAITLKQYRDAALIVCEKYSVPYLDLYRISANPRITGQTVFYTDSIHPNELGYARDMLQFESFLKSL